MPKEMPRCAHEIIVKWSAKRLADRAPREVRRGPDQLSEPVCGVVREVGGVAVPDVYRQQLLGGDAGVADVHLVAEPDLLRAHRDHRGGHPQRGLATYLTQVADVRLDGVQRAAGLDAVALVQANQLHHPVGGEAEHQHVVGLTEVAVVVGPLRTGHVGVVGQSRCGGDPGGRLAGHRALPRLARTARCTAITARSRSATNSAMLLPAAALSHPSTTASRSSRVSAGASSRVHGDFSDGPKWSSMCAMPPSPPARWNVSIGPCAGQRSPGPSVIAVSICSTVASPLATMCSASRHSASCSRFAMKPGSSWSMVITDLPTRE